MLPVFPQHYIVPFNWMNSSPSPSLSGDAFVLVLYANVAKTNRQRQVLKGTGWWWLAGLITWLNKQILVKNERLALTQEFTKAPQEHKSQGEKERTLAIQSQDQKRLLSFDYKTTKGIDTFRCGKYKWKIANIFLCTSSLSLLAQFKENGFWKWTYCLCEAASSKAVNPFSPCTDPSHFFWGLSYWWAKPTTLHKGSSLCSCIAQTIKLSHQFAGVNYILEHVTAVAGSQHAMDRMVALHS